jgi:hypothetical protein
VFCIETGASSGRTKRLFHRKSIAMIDAIEHVLNVANSYLAYCFESILNLLLARQRKEFCLKFEEAGGMHKRGLNLRGLGVVLKVILDKSSGQSITYGYGPFSLCVIHKEGLCPSSGDINRLIMIHSVHRAPYWQTFDIWTYKNTYHSCFIPEGTETFQIFLRDTHILS